MKAILLAVLFAASIGFAAPPVAPEYPGKTKVNNALKHLKEAQEALSGNPAKTADAIAYLKQAEESVMKMKNDKGSFRGTALRMTQQAIKSLEGENADKAMHEIDQAINATNEAGKNSPTKK